MSGFCPETREFMLGLYFHNDRQWFSEHKGEYEEFLKKPLNELAQSVRDIMAKKLYEEELELHVCRIYRDARRLFGRGPFKEHMWFSLEKGEGPSFWFEISPFSYSCGMGFWAGSAAVGECWRRAIDKDPRAFEKLVKAIGGEYTLWGEKYKRPKGSYPEPVASWYERKSVSVGWTREYEQGLYDPDLAQRIADAFMELLPMYRFIKEVFRAAGRT